MEKELLTDDYLESTKLQEVLHNLFDRLVILRPADPLYWLAHHNDPESSSLAKKRVFPMKNYHLPAGQPLFMNGMFQVESYLEDKKIDRMLLEILEDTLEKRPKNVNKFIASWAEQRLAEHDAEIGSFSAGDTEDDDLEDEDFGADDGGEGSERSSTLSSFVDSDDEDDVTSSDGSDFSITNDEDGEDGHHHHHHHRHKGSKKVRSGSSRGSSRSGSRISSPRKESGKISSNASSYPPMPPPSAGGNSRTQQSSTTTTSGGGAHRKVASDSPVKQFPPPTQPKAHFDPTLV